MGGQYISILPSGLRPSGSIGVPWADNAALGQHNVSLGQYIFPYPSGRGGILYHLAEFATNRVAAALNTVFDHVDVGKWRGALNFLQELFIIPALPGIQTF